MTEKTTPKTEAFDAAYRDFLAAVQEPWEDMQRQLMEAQFHYARAAQEASMHPDAVNLNARAHRAFLAATGGVAKDVDFHGAVEEAYRSYLEATKQAWTEADIGTLDASALAAVGNQALSVCSWVTWGLQQTQGSAADTKQS